MRVDRLLCVSVALVSMTIGPAGAGQYRDSREYCQSIAGGSYSLLEACMKREAEAEERISPRRSRIDGQIWNYCAGIVGHSWSLMESCVQREEDAKRRLGM